MQEKKANYYDNQLIISVIFEAKCHHMLVPASTSCWTERRPFGNCDRHLFLQCYRLNKNIIVQIIVRWIDNENCLLSKWSWLNLHPLILSITKTMALILFEDGQYSTYISLKRHIVTQLYFRCPIFKLTFKHRISTVTYHLPLTFLRSWTILSIKLGLLLWIWVRREKLKTTCVWLGGVGVANSGVRF